MKRLALLCCASALAACASAPPPPGTQVSASRLQQTVVPGQTTKPELLAAFGATRSIAFDSGYEVWLYQTPAGPGRYREAVILIDPRGVVAKTRSGPLSAAQP